MHQALIKRAKVSQWPEYHKSQNCKKFAMASIVVIRFLIAVYINVIEFDI